MIPRLTAVLYTSAPELPPSLLDPDNIYASSMIKTFPTLAASIALVLASDAPITLPIKSDGFLMTTE